MKVSFSKPTTTSLVVFLQEQANNKTSYNYKFVNATQNPPIKGFNNDYSFAILGKGDKVWKAARKVLMNWQQFPEPWMKILPEKTKLRSGEAVAVLFRLFGIWWINSARIVYTLDDTHRFGFAYGTLQGHVERGEECFWLERRDDAGEVSYHIRAFSRPAYWFVWLGYPIARMYQRRFVRQSLQRMKTLSNEQT